MPYVSLLIFGDTPKLFDSITQACLSLNLYLCLLPALRRTRAGRCSCRFDKVCLFLMRVKCFVAVTNMPERHVARAPSMHA
jgi:hypothetical protein